MKTKLSFDIIQEQILDFLKKSRHRSDLSLITRLMDEGIIDSMNFVELVLFVESVFGIRMQVSDMRIEHFETIETFAQYVFKKCFKE